MRRSAVLSLALLVALPAWAAAQVITLPSEPGFGFKDTPPTVPASRLIPQAMADAARLSDFRATIDLTRAFVVGTDLSRVPALLNVGIAQQITTFPQSTSWGGHLDDTKEVTGPVDAIVVRRACRHPRQGRVLVRLRPAVAALRSRSTASTSRTAT